MPIVKQKGAWPPRTGTGKRMRIPLQRLKAKLHQQGGRCFYCHKLCFVPQEMGQGLGMANPPKALRATLDHKKPRHSNGGHKVDNNIVAACYRCNQEKGPLDLPTFMRLRHDLKALKEAKNAATVPG